MLLPWHLHPLLGCEMMCANNKGINSESSEDKTCESLMARILGHTCSSSMPLWQRCTSRVWVEPCMCSATWGSLNFRWATFCLSFTPEGRLVGSQYCRKFNGKWSARVMTSANSWLWGRWARKGVVCQAKHSKDEQVGILKDQQVLRLSGSFRI